MPQAISVPTFSRGQGSNCVNPYWRPAMLASKTSNKIRHIVSNSSVLVVVGMWIYYSMSNIEALF